MTLRWKLAAALLPMVVALGLVGALALQTVDSLARNSEAILRDNFRSVLAAQRMKEAIERMHERGLRLLLFAGEVAPADASTDPRAQFDHELAVQRGNVTEVGEDKVVSELVAAWQLYQQAHDQLTKSDGSEAARKTIWRENMEPAFVAVRRAADEILAMNQDAIVRKSEHARRDAERRNTLVVLAILAAGVLGVLASVLATSRLLRPLSLLARTVRRIGEGDFEARASVAGRDELAALAATVNAMAQKLSQYRRSSFGELLLAQHASQAAIDSLPDPVMVFDLGGRMLNCNRAAEETLGADLQDGAGLERVPEPIRAAIEQTCGHVLSGKGPYLPKGFEEALRISAADGERYFLPRATPVYAEAGSIGGVTVVLQDVTRLRRVDELRGNLVATVAHELRTPLTSLRMAVHLLIEQTAGPLTEKQADLLYATRDDCDRLQATVDELLDLARIQGGHLELRYQPVAVAALVSSAVDAFRSSATAQQVSLETKVAPGLGEIHVDRERLHIVLSNLLSNALRHSPAGGVVELRASVDDDHARFEIADNGPGIPIEYQQSIFERFLRVPGSAPGGAGIGLAIAKEIVEAHGGEIGVRSTPGRGAIFWFTVPRIQRRQTTARPS
jgi:PAS domain S-box-containing protein